MRLFKTTYKNRQGVVKKASKWYCEIRDHNSIVRRLPAFTSKAASDEMGRNLDLLVSYHKGSGGQIDPKLTRWLTGLPQTTRKKLVSIGLIDAQRGAVAKVLAEHVADWRKSLDAKGGTAAHVDLVVSRVSKVISGCRFKFIDDIQASKVQSFLHDMRQDKGDKRGISAQTFSFYVAGVKQFCRWMVKDNRAVQSPVAHLEGLNVATDRRHDRRALTLDELTNLIQTTRNEPTRHGMAGECRALCYRLAIETGLRSNELRSLTASSFELAGESPTVTVAAAYSKHRRDDVLPIRKAIADDLRTFLGNVAPDTKVFPLPEGTLAGRMFQKDRAAAGIVHRDATGRVVDWHALRHSFISNLARGGVHPKTAQVLARHGSIGLTMDTYSHVLREHEVKALDVLPDLSDAGQKARANATDGSVLASRLLSFRRLDESCVDASRRSDANGTISDNCDIPKENGGIRDEKLVECGDWRGGRAADCTGLENRAKQVGKSNRKSNQQSTLNAASETAQNSVLASCLLSIVQNHPELVTVIETWPHIPASYAANLLQIIQAGKLLGEAQKKKGGSK